MTVHVEEEDIEAGPPSSPPAKEKRRLESLKQNLKLIVREDGTVDWDEARASGREVAKFGKLGVGFLNLKLVVE